MSNTCQTFFGDQESPTNKYTMDRVKMSKATKQFQHDVSAWQKTLETNSQASTEAQESAAVCKRLFLTLREGAIDIQENKTGGASKRDDTKKDMPTASPLSHGARVDLKFENKADKKKFMNWLVSEQEGGSLTEKVKDSSVVEERPMSTHTIGKDGVEIKGQKAAALNTAAKFTGKSDKQFGMSVAFGGEGNKDNNGKVIEQKDGEHGYLFVNMSTTNNYVMIGIENSAYGKQGEHATEAHGLKGFTNKTSFTGGNKFSGFSKKDREDYNLPDGNGIGQIRIHFSSEEVNSLTQKKALDFDLDDLRKSTNPKKKDEYAVSPPEKSVRFEALDKNGRFKPAPTDGLNDIAAASPAPLKEEKGKEKEERGSSSNTTSVKEPQERLEQSDAKNAAPDKSVRFAAKKEIIDIDSRSQQENNESISLTESAEKKFSGRTQSLKNAQQLMARRSHPSQEQEAAPEGVDLKTLKDAKDIGNSLKRSGSSETIDASSGVSGPSKGGGGDLGSHRGGGRG